MTDGNQGVARSKENEEDAFLEAFAAAVHDTEAASAARKDFYACRADGYFPDLEFYYKKR